MDVALVEHAEHDVHRDDRGEDQPKLVRERALERGRGALKLQLCTGRQSDLSAKAARSVKGGPVDIRGGATDTFAKIGNIKGESFSVDIGTSERLKW